MANPDGLLLREICKALFMTQADLGAFLGVSRRTAQRIAAGRSSVGADGWAKLAQAIHPRNPPLASEVAARGGQTLATLGLFIAQPDPRIADGVVYAAAEEMDVSPRAIRPALRAAFRRARELGLSVETLAAALEEAKAPEPLPKSA